MAVLRADADCHAITAGGEVEPRGHGRKEKPLWEPREKACIQAAPRPSISVLQEHDLGTMRPSFASPPVDALVATSPAVETSNAALGTTTPQFIQQAMEMLAHAVQASHSDVSARAAAHARAGALEAELKAAAAKADAREKALTTSFRSSAREREAALEAELQIEREARAALAAELADARAATAAAEAAAAAGPAGSPASRLANTAAQGSQDDVETADCKEKDAEKCARLEAENMRYKAEIKELNLQLKRLAGRHKDDQARVRFASQFIPKGGASSLHKRRRLSRSTGTLGKHGDIGCADEQPQAISNAEHSLELLSVAGPTSPAGNPAMLAPSPAISPLCSATSSSPVSSRAADAALISPAVSAAAKASPGGADASVVDAVTPQATARLAAGGASVSPNLAAEALSTPTAPSANPGASSTPASRTTPVRAPPSATPLQDAPRRHPRRAQSAAALDAESRCAFSTAAAATATTTTDGQTRQAHSTTAFEEIPGLRILKDRHKAASSLATAIEPDAAHQVPLPPMPHQVPRQVRAVGRTTDPAPPQKGQVKCRCVVRGKEKRLGLQAFDCDQCQAFYKATGVVVSSKPPIRAASRHRFEHPPTSTPEGFWDLSFPNKEPTEL